MRTASLVLGSFGLGMLLVGALGPSGPSSTSDHRAVHSPRSLQPLTRARFLAFRETDPAYYSEERFAYMSVASDLAALVHPRSCLELGPHKAALLLGCHTMDRSNYMLHTYTLDATKAPWPIPARHYDVLLALQVMEHLTLSQATVFREMRRVARAAVISLPIRWNMPGDAWHHNLTLDEVSSWFSPSIPSIRIDIPVGRRACDGPVRSVFFFDFDAAPERTIVSCWTGS